MPLTRFLKYVSIFAATFIVGIASVSLFGFIFGHDHVSNNRAATPVRSMSVGADADTTDVSMDDQMFTAPNVDETNPKAFDPEGIYEVDGDLPGEFNDFGGFVLNNKKLDVACDSKEFGELTTPSGFAFSDLPSKSEVDSHSLKVAGFNLSNGPMTFETEAKNGTSYKFEGKFLINGNFYTLDPEAKVLSGRLIKLRDGKKIAETEVSFTWSIDLTCVC